ncbi:hypothetical protein ETB97_000332 [Aspergillus alliaceus]|uniref:Uncharacterized protein n=1 Tax=Petromyces alliaceus TaxID=209559 RepID=A0A5N7CKA9_PETAA|nr:hypothetical protein BDV23DRAFT_190119 [Aspergillus alliaceus]KAF5861369.1 hypothetical protein ETB97_000332 [Aspergillus burnettii]
MDAEPPTPTSQDNTMPEFTPINGSPPEIAAPSVPTTTPTKRGKWPAATNSENAKAGSPPKKTKTASASSAKTVLGPIPTSLGAAGLSDKMILQMRDEEGKNWGELNEAWMKTTGIKVGASTLRMRYTAMKANFVEMNEDDEARFLRSKKEIEENFEQEKWHRIAEAIEVDGGGKYPVTALQKKFKQLIKKGNHAGAVKDEE